MIITINSDRFVFSMHFWQVLLITKRARGQEFFVELFKNKDYCRVPYCRGLCASVSKPNTVIFQSCLPCCPPCPLPLWQVPIHQFRTNLLFLRDGPKRLTKNNSDIINYPSDTMSQRSTVKRVAKYLEAHLLGLQASWEVGSNIVRKVW